MHFKYTTHLLVEENGDAWWEGGGSWCVVRCLLLETRVADISSALKRGRLVGCQTEVGWLQRLGLWPSAASTVHLFCHQRCPVCSAQGRTVRRAWVQLEDASHLWAVQLLSSPGGHSCCSGCVSEGLLEGWLLWFSWLTSYCTLSQSSLGLHALVAEFLSNTSQHLGTFSSEFLQWIHNS